MNDSLIIAIWVILIVYVLQVVLFFKIWIMTNDVKKIKKGLIYGSDDSLKTAKKEIMLGHYDKALEIYNNSFVNDVMKIYEKVCRNKWIYSDSEKDEFVEDYNARYKEVCKFYEKELSILDNYSIDFSRFDSFDKVNTIFGKV